MIWMKLKLDTLPIIASEIDKVAKEYMGIKIILNLKKDLVEEVRGGDKIAKRNLILLQA